MARIPLATAISLIAGTLVLSSCSSNPVDIDTADDVTNAVHNTSNIPAATEDDIEIIDLNAVTYTKQGQVMTLAEKKAHNERRRRQIASQRTAQKQDQQTDQLRRIRQKEWEARQQSYHDKWQRDQAAKKNQARVAATQRQREQEQKRAQQQAQAAQQRAQAAQRAENAAYEREQEQIRKGYHARYQQEQARKRQQQQRAAIPRLATPIRAYQPPRASANSRPMASAARPQSSWSSQWSERLSQAALARTQHNVVYNGRYEKIGYPWGDVSPNIGVCTDVVIRSYRKLGIDLQRDVHEDMKQNFTSYPRLSKWKLKAPDPNIDHRRVYNLQAFFNTNGETLPITNDPRDYKPGDIVTWNLFPGQEHIGIVVNKRSPTDPNRYMIVHNIAEGPKLEDVLFQFRITGHYRYYGRGV